MECSGKQELEGESFISTYLLVYLTSLYHLIKCLLPEQFFSLATIWTRQQQNQLTLFPESESNRALWLGQPTTDKKTVVLTQISTTDWLTGSDRWTKKDKTLMHVESIWKIKNTSSHFLLKFCSSGLKRSTVCLQDFVTWSILCT